ncbi:MAG TPA: L-histidine N(alpha)-methyltransferase [Verrucomicrobiae bacterium]|nr:L-histidine N(alpha)-methyltransferase [Verrucomicrobiae bacterium]
MRAAATVLIDPSQFPEALQADLVASLRTRQVNQKFHYMTYRQAEQWLALHEAYSPARKDADCKAIYDKAFAAAGKLSVSEVIGLGCGGGQKDARLLAKLARKNAHYTPVDASLPLVLSARANALEHLPEERIRPGVVCDLGTASGLAFEGAPRLMTFFGMLPNFEPNDIIPRVSGLLARGDFLLCSANLAPGADYAKGVQQVLPQYENALTNDWLMTFLLDLGIEKDAGNIEWKIEPSAGLFRITAHFRFDSAAEITYANNHFKFSTGDSIRLFFSYRYTPYLLEKMLAAQGLHTKTQWTTRSGEEAVFLCQKG